MGWQHLKKCREPIEIVVNLERACRQSFKQKGGTLEHLYKTFLLNIKWSKLVNCLSTYY